MSYVVMVVSDKPLMLARMRHHKFNNFHTEDEYFVYYRYDEVLSLAHVIDLMGRIDAHQCYVMRYLLNHQMGENHLYQIFKQRIHQGNTHRRQPHFLDDVVYHLT